MTQDNPERYDLSRRKVLGGLTAVGVASVGAGLGTSAYFSDEETYEGNVLTAGALDLRVDWEEHYSDWSDDEADGIQHGVHMERPDSGDVQVDPAEFVGLPDPQNAMVYVHDDPEVEDGDDLDTFMTNTAIEAFPDHGNNGSASLHRINQPCVELANDDVLSQDPANPNNLRTNNDDTVDENGNPKPLVSLNDVKPGDFGELTLSFHLCDNPGYVWFQGDLVSNAENGTTEPESEDPDEQDGTQSGELADTIRTAVWYDEDGDNVIDQREAGQQVDVVLVLDRSGSMGSNNKLANAKDAAKNLVDALSLGSNAGQIGVVSFADDVRLDQGLTTNPSDAKSAIDGLSDSGTTNIEGAVDQAHEELLQGDQFTAYSESGNARASAEKVMVVLSDGAPNVNGDGTAEGDADFGDADPADNASAAKSAGIELFTVGFGISSGDPTAALLEEMASSPKDDHFFLASTQEIQQVFGQISQQLAGEEVFFRGTLAELLDEASQGLGIPLDGDRSTSFDELNDPPSADSRECYVDSTTNAIGLAWWLPVDHGNEVQTDSVEFDIGFYTEQCRHNDGSGLAQQTPSS